MEHDFSSLDSSQSGSSIMPYGSLAPLGCAVCSSKSGLLLCGRCKVVHYCGAAHQKAHRSEHKAVCNAIGKNREALEREEAALRAHPGDFMMPANVFDTRVGRFWGILGTRPYMRARFAYANELLRIDTVRAVETALENFNEMLQLCRSDNMGIRDIVPHLLLRLGHEQECYDFLKWWATIDDKDHYNGNYDWGDTTLPYLDIHGADAFEPIDMFCSGGPGLSHLVALTLLKLRLYLDLSAHEVEASSQGIFGFGTFDPEPDRPLGRLARTKIRASRASPMHDISMTVETLEDQYRRLCGMVHDANSFFWEALVEGEDTAPPAYYSPGSEEEADLVLHQCQRAWEETEDAIGMVDADTSKFTRVYQGTTTAVGNTPSEGLRRGTGNAFPSPFKPLPSTSSPAELFPPTPMGHSETIRFVSRNNRRKVLVFADGACPNNGQLEPRGGWAVVCGTSEGCVVSGRLEDKGPFGDDSTATSNRAELRAAIAALRLCDWKAEGYDSIVIATDSSYVFSGATSWAKGWVRNGWTTRTGADVKNKDLWELFLGEVERWEGQELLVELWNIPRTLNGDADAAAKRAANEPAESEFRDVTTGSSQAMIPRAVPGNRILALCLEQEGLFDACFESLVSQITSKVKLERATTREAALAALTQDSPPSVILVVDGALTRQKKVWECVIDRLREGATVVLAGCFSSMVNEGEFSRFFARLGLPWERGSYHRATVHLRRGVVDGRLASHLPSAYSQKALFVRNIERSVAWYAETETSNEAAVVFAKVGSGRLGYIGDVNGEESTDTVVLAMCGLLD